MLGCLHSTPIGCFGADTIRPAYGIPVANDPAVNGTGRTIVIIDAFKNPNIQTDLGPFRWLLEPSRPAQLHRPVAVWRPRFRCHQKDPAWLLSRDFDRRRMGAHAVAPGAALVLVQAISEKDVDLVGRLEVRRRQQPGRRDHPELRRGRVVHRPGRPCGPACRVRGRQPARNHGPWPRPGDQGGARQSCDGTTLVAGPSTPASDPEVPQRWRHEVGYRTARAHMSRRPPGIPPMGAATRRRRSQRGRVQHPVPPPRPTRQPFQKNNKARGVPDVAYDAYFMRNTGFIAVYSGIITPPKTNPFGVIVVGGTQRRDASVGRDRGTGRADGGSTGSGRSTRRFTTSPRATPTPALLHDVTTGNNRWGGLPRLRRRTGLGCCPPASARRTYRICSPCWPLVTTAKAEGTKQSPWHLKTPSGSSEYQLYKDDAADPAGTGLHGRQD